MMEYLRVEFAGIELTANNETNSITLGGVGRGTKFEHIMVSFGGDDGIEWFGGSVDGKYMVVQVPGMIALTLTTAFPVVCNSGWPFTTPAMRTSLSQMASNGIRTDRIILTALKPLS
ncbi:hypothetical protein ACFOET_11090 [Parapedobacter deserti]|uniref:Jacalin-type lectin domain-containing protein n=1 Tax=Parapedobacter deserti TaxID=1912957 RepID=A0ABV7JPY0_9SPHI